MNRNLSPQFQMGPSMKDKPNSQGTLFRVSADARRPEMRQPRGFSPERRRQVGAAVGHVYGVGGVYTAPGERAALVNNLARSTVPVGHLIGAVKWHTGADEFLGEGNNGEYRRGLNSILLAHGREQKSTVIHELGHALSKQFETAHSAYDTSTRRGQEEAFADNYATDHSRSSGYKQKPNHPPAADYSAASYRGRDWGLREGPGATDFVKAYANDRTKEPPQPIKLRAHQQKYDEQDRLFYSSASNATWKNNYDVNAKG